MNNKKRVIVNVGVSGRTNYALGSLRLLEQWTKQKIDCDIILFTPELEEKTFTLESGNRAFVIKSLPDTKKFGKPKDFSVAKHQFKAYAIQYARELGYERIVWADSSTIIKKNIEHYWELLNELGIILFDNPGCPIGTWTNKYCLDKLGMTYEESMKYFQCDAFLMFWDFTKEKVANMFNRYIDACNDLECINGQEVGYGGFKAHRHDQSIISVIAKQNHINYLNYGTWVYGRDENLFSPCFCKVGI
jgi:hypothetical protein